MVGVFAAAVITPLIVGLSSPLANYIMAPIRAALANTPAQPALFNKASSPSANVIMSPSILRIIGPDQSSLGTLVVVVVGIGITILVTIQGIGY